MRGQMDFAMTFKGGRRTETQQGAVRGSRLKGRRGRRGEEGGRGFESEAVTRLDDVQAPWSPAVFDQLIDQTRTDEGRKEGGNERCYGPRGNGAPARVAPRRFPAACRFTPRRGWEALGAAARKIELLLTATLGHNSRKHLVKSHPLPFSSFPPPFRERCTLFGATPAS